MAFCNMCGTQIPDGATTCAACAGRIPAASTAAATATQGMTDNVAGMLAYITIIPAIVFLVVEPYNRNRFIRFHCLQCLFFARPCSLGSRDSAFLPVIPGLALLTFLF